MTEDQILLKLALDATSANQSTAQVVELQKKAAAQFVETWSSAAKKRADTELSIERDKQQKLTLMEKAGHDARVAAYQAAEDRRVRIGQKNYQNTLNQRKQNAALQAEIAAGSGGYGSLPTGVGTGGGRDDLKSGVSAGIATAIAGGGAVATAKAVGIVAAGAKLEKWISSIIDGGNPFKGLKGIAGAIKKVGGYLVKYADILGAAITTVASAYQVVRLTKASTDANQARQQEVFSHFDLAQQSGSIAGRMGVDIDELQARGGIGPVVAERLRAMSGNGSDQQRVAQRYLLAALNKQDALEAERRAKAEHDAAAAASYAQRAAEAKAKAEAESAAHLRETVGLNREYNGLAKRAAGIRSAAGKIDQESVTIGDLAGRDYVNRLNADYGAGGRFDLAAGDGPFTGYARGYLREQKKQQWDIIHGNAIFDDKNVLVGGDAYADKQRQIGYHNLLKGAGMDTPTMQIAEMRDSLATISEDMTSLLAVAEIKGIVIKGTD